MRIAFLCSGGGGNLRFIHDTIECGILPAVICGVFVDRECGAAEFARNHDIPLMSGSMQPALSLLNPDLIISGFHRMIPPEVVARYRRRIINLHYSLLPDFGGPGMIGEKPVRLALERGDRVIGTTVHYVDETLDGGEIISQSRVLVRSGEPFESLMNRVFYSGCVNLLETIHKFIDQDKAA